MENEITAEMEVAAKYDHTESQLKKVAEANKDFKVTTENIEQAKEIKKDIRTLTKAIEARHKELKKFYLDGGRAVDGQKNKLIGIVEPEYDRFSMEIAAVEQIEKDEKTRKERATLLPDRKAKCAALEIFKTDDELLLMPDLVFMQLISDAQQEKIVQANKIIEDQRAEQIKQAKEKKRLEDLEQAKKEAAEKATKDAENKAQAQIMQAKLDADKKIQDEKDAAAKKIKDEADEKERKEKQIIASGEAAMLEHYLKQIRAVTKPQFENGSAYQEPIDIIEGICKEWI